MLDLPDLISAALDVAVDVMRSILSKHYDVNVKDLHGQSSLHISAYLGNYEISDLLIKYGAEVNAKDENDLTPLAKACAADHFKIVKLLMDNKADINIADNRMRRPLHICASNNSIQSLKLILDYISCVNAVDEDGRSAVHHAVLNGNFEILKLLVEKGASLSICDKNGTCPIHWAASMDKKEILTYLLQNECNVNSLDKNMYTPLHVAASMGSLDCLEILIDYISLDTLTADKNTPLHLACANKNMSLVSTIINALNSDQLFLEYLKDLDPVNLKEWTVEKRQLFLKNRVNKVINMQNNQYFSPLHILLQFEGGERCIDQLLLNGANPNLPSDDGKTSLHYAVLKNEENILRRLLNYNPDINVQDENENTPLHYACKLGLDFIVELLIEHGADILIPGEEGRLPIHVAAAYGHNSCLQKLFNPLIRKSDINDLECDIMGRNLIHCAVQGESLKCLETLLRLGCDYKLEDSSKMTPLHVAVKLNNFQMSRIFLKLGCNVKAVDEFGCAPLHYAAMHNDDGSIIKLLLEYKADTAHKIQIQDPVLYLEPVLTNSSHQCDYRIAFPIHFAVISGNITGMKIIYEEMDETLQTLVLYGCQKNQYDNLSNAPEVLSLINLAAYHDQFSVITFWYRKYKNIATDIVDKCGRTPLHIAAYQGNKTIIKFLLSVGADVTAIDNDYSWNPIHYASSQGRDTSIAEILNYRKDKRHDLVNCLDEHHRTPFMLAVQNGHISTCEILLKCNADVNFEDAYGRTALHRASANGHVNCVKLLLEFQADIGLADFRGRTAFHMAATAGHLEILKLLMKTAQLSCGEEYLDYITSFWFDKNAFSPLHYAVVRGHYECCSYLLELLSERIELEQVADMTLLHCAIESKSEKIVALVLQATRNSSIDVPDCHSWTPIFYACYNDNRDILSQLLKFNADVNYQDELGRAPFLICAKTNSSSCLEGLLEECSTLKWATVDNTDKNVLHWAAEGRNNDLGCYLLKKLPNVITLINAKDRACQTPAHLAVKYGLVEYLAGLIKSGADLFCYNSEKQLPLAAFSDNEKVTRCISLCLSAMFPSDIRLKLPISLTDTSQKGHSGVVQLKEHIEIDESIISSENEYF